MQIFEYLLKRPSGTACVIHVLRRGVGLNNVLCDGTVDVNKWRFLNLTGWKKKIATQTDISLHFCDTSCVQNWFPSPKSKAMHTGLKKTKMIPV